MLLRALSYVSFLILGTASTADAQFGVTYEEAVEAAALVGVSPGPGNCGGCHAPVMADRPALYGWASVTSNIEFDCLNKPTPEEAISCIEGPDGQLTPSDLGIYTAAFHQQKFLDLYLARDPVNGAADHAAALARVQMPPAGNRVPDDDADLMVRWANAYLPHLEEIINPYPGPLTCTDSMGNSDLIAYTQRMAIEGWGPRNQQNFISMFACPLGNTDPLQCFQQAKADGSPVFLPLGVPGNGDLEVHEGQLRLISEVDFRTDFWIRSSADGRFMAAGGSPSIIMDLQPILQSAGTQVARKITVDADFDPSFFPDNLGFAFQGSGTGMCSQAILLDASISHIDFTQPGCNQDSQTGLDLYQSIAAGLDHNDYLSITGQFNGDSGSGSFPPIPSPVSIPEMENFREEPRRAVDFSQQNTLSLTPFEFDGTRWLNGSPTNIPSPWLLDWQLSPSGGVAIGRREVAQQGDFYHLGYEFYMVERIDTGPNSSPRYQIDHVGTSCVPGRKSSVSFDERYMVTYGRDGGAAGDNREKMWLLDIVTGQSSLVVTGAAHMRVMFPHFRSDGWFYFLTLNETTGERQLWASDAALR